MPRPTPPAPHGMRWCARHKTFHLVADFSPTDYYCREGRREYERGRKPGAVAVAKAKPPAPLKQPPSTRAPVIKASPPKKGWRALPTPEVHTLDAEAKATAEPVPAGEPWTREATEHEAAMLAHGANVVSQIRAAHFALDVITSGWALMNKGAAT